MLPFWWPEAVISPLEDCTASVISIVVDILDAQATYDVNASTETAFRLKLRKRLRRFHFLVDLGRVVDINSSVVGCGSQEFTLWTDSQSPMLSGFFACELYQRSNPSHQ